MDSNSRGRSERISANPTALVIGAGIGGIAAAARLAKNGYQVTVLEKNAQPGGRCGRLDRDGHCFDIGPTLYLMPELYAQTFTDLGERIEDHLELLRVDPTYTLHFHDGVKLSLSSDLNAMKPQLEAIEPGSFEAYLQYLCEGHRHYNLTLENFGSRDFRTLSEFANPNNFLALLKIKGLTKHYHHIGKYFSDPRLKAAFTFQNMYMGLSPYKAPATYSLLQYSEFADGVWFPRGGMYRIIEALVNIAQGWGAQFQYKAPVGKIDLGNNKVTGVTLADGRQLRADILIANADLPYVYRQLLPGSRTGKRIARKQHTCSTITFFWGMDERIHQLGAHNLFFGDDYRLCFDDVIGNRSLPDDPMIYIHAPTRIDPCLAPVGGDTLEVVVPVGHIQNNASQDWGALKKKARACALQRLEGIGVRNLERKIKFEETYTPQVWQNLFNLARGSTHGLDHNLMQMAYFRPRAQHARYRNLYFVGASTHPGTGLPAVLISARHATERILHAERGATRFHHQPTIEENIDALGGIKV